MEHREVSYAEWYAFVEGRSSQQRGRHRCNRYDQTSEDSFRSSYYRSCASRQRALRLSTSLENRYSIVSPPSSDRCRKYRSRKPKVPRIRRSRGGIESENPNCWSQRSHFSYSYG